MGFLKNLISKIKHKKAEKTAAKIEQTTQIAQVDQKTFDQGLKKSGGVLKTALDDLVKQHKKVDAAMLESIEEMLIGFDVGTGATKKIMLAIEDEIKYQNVNDPKLVKQIIIDKIFIYYIQDSILDNDLEHLKNITNFKRIYLEIPQNSSQININYMVSFLKEAIEISKGKDYIGERLEVKNYLRNMDNERLIIVYRNEIETEMHYLDIFEELQD